MPVAGPRTSAYGAATQRVGPATAMAGMPTGAISDYQYGEPGDDGYPPDQRRRRLTMWLWIAGAVIVLGVVAGVAYAILGGGSGNAVPQVDGLTLQQAETAITHAGLTFKVVPTPSLTTPKNVVIKTSPPNGNAVPAGSQVQLFVSTGPKKVQVPDVKGLSAGAATSKLKSEGFLVNQQTDSNSAKPAGTVVKQSPSPGKTETVGTQVTIFVSGGGVTVPGVVGDTYQEALSKLSSAGLTNVVRQFTQNPQLANGTVASQSPNAGKNVTPNTQITLLVVKNQPSPPPSSPPASPTPTPTPTPSVTPPA
jgi:serine/threonine-protein kinase